MPGLEIVAPDGDWTPVVPEEGLFLVNLGDLLAEWTNDRWRSTLHRVVPPAGDGPARRRSAAFFHDGNYDAWVVVPAHLRGRGRGAPLPAGAGGRAPDGQAVERPNPVERARAGIHDTVGDRLEAVTRSLTR